MKRTHPIILLVCSVLLVSGCATSEKSRHGAGRGAAKSIAERPREYNPVSRSFDPAPPFGSRRNSSGY